MKGKLRSFVLGAAVVLLTGCAGQQQKMEFTGGSGSQEQFNADSANCTVQADSIQIADYEYRGTFMEGANIKQKQTRTFYNCMLGKGYKDRNA